MASKYWVGGTNNWNATEGTKWSLTSGGAGGQLIPSASDDVFFDAASGNITCTLQADMTIKSINCTGFIGTITSSSRRLFCVGLSASIGPKGSYYFSIRMDNATGPITVGTNGAVLNGYFQKNSLIAMSLSSAFICTEQFIANAGTFTTNNYPLTCSALQAVSTAAKTFNVGTSIITLTLGIEINQTGGMTWNALAGSELRLGTGAAGGQFLTNTYAFNKNWDFGPTVIVVDGYQTGGTFSIEGNHTNFRFKYNHHGAPFTLNLGQAGTFTISSWEGVTGAARVERRSPNGLTGNYASQYNPVASALNEYGAPYEAFRSFSGVAGSFSHSDTTTGLPWWIKIYLPRAITVDSYKVQMVRGPGLHNWKSWTLEGSANDTTWTVVDTVVNEPAWGAGEWRTYTCDLPGQTFIRWRWVVTLTESGTQYAEAGQLELWGPVASNVITVNVVGGGTKATFVKTTGEVRCDYISLLNNWASGGAQFLAGANSTIGANVQGWTLTGEVAQSRAIMMM